MAYNTFVFTIDTLGELISMLETEQPPTENEESTNVNTEEVFTDQISVTKPIHTNMVCRDVRLATFRNWPMGLKQRPEELADAGLFYTGLSDKTLCFFCDHEVSRWAPDDDPWLKHATRSSNGCQYLVMSRGSKYAYENPDNDSTKEIVEETKTKQQTVDQHGDNVLCLICLERPRDVCLLPCKHVIICGRCVCSIHNQQCPVCRAEFYKIVQVFLS